MRGSGMSPVPLNWPVDGSNTSAVARTARLWIMPPAIRTRPSASRVALWIARRACIWVHVGQRSRATRSENSGWHLRVVWVDDYEMPPEAPVLILVSATTFIPRRGREVLAELVEIDRLGILGVAPAGHAVQADLRFRVGRVHLERVRERRLGHGRVSGPFERQSQIVLERGDVRVQLHCARQGAEGIRVAAALDQQQAHVVHGPGVARVDRDRAAIRIEGLIRLAEPGVDAA